jgi:hypothetical protein
LRDEDDEDDRPKERWPRPSLPAEGRPSGIVTVADLASQLTPERLRWLARRRALGLDFRHLSAITDKWGYIRQGYMEHMPDIMAAARKNRRGWIAPYFYDWSTYFSPIEEVAWHAIRGHYGIPLYPQFPLFNFFVDFANPYVCVGVEMDGKAYHDEAKDRVRDELLVKYGWRIFRIKGAECFREYKLPIEMEEEGVPEDDRYAEIENWLMNTCDGVIKAIEVVYFRAAAKRDGYAHLDLALRTLDKHRLVDFELLTEEMD